MISLSCVTAHVFYFVQVTMKHSGSLFLYAGDNGGAFAKNSYGNLYVMHRLRGTVWYL